VYPTRRRLSTPQIHSKPKEKLKSRVSACCITLCGFLVLRVSSPQAQAALRSLLRVIRNRPSSRPQMIVRPSHEPLASGRTSSTSRQNGGQ
jgi:hypothetical protein